MCYRHNAIKNDSTLKDLALLLALGLKHSSDPSSDLRDVMQIVASFGVSIVPIQLTIQPSNTNGKALKNEEV
jgi:hypothetical protein